MLNAKEKMTTAGLVLSKTQERTLQKTFQETVHLHFYNELQQADLADLQSKRPCLLWVSSTGLCEIQTLPAPIKKELALMPKVLLLDSAYALKDLEAAIDAKPQEIIRPPLRAKDLRAALTNALEIQDIHHDILCMSREIMLERELLSRKNNLLQFMVKFFEGIIQRLQTEEILKSAFTALALILPVRHLHALFWQNTPHSAAQLTLFIQGCEQDAVSEYWQQALLKEIPPQYRNNLCQTIFFNAEMQQTINSNTKNIKKNHLTTIQLHQDSEHFGTLFLILETSKNLGRDYALAFEAAMKHLTLALHHSLHMSSLQMDVNFDRLTQVHSRRHFEDQFTTEFKRSTRYNQPLSVILLDIDDFKKVNDTFGHMFGDTVLANIGSILSSTIRSTDYCARFGGEEFIVLLPSTGKECAMALADRIREKIADHVYYPKGKHFSVQASFGVTTLTQGSSINQADLLKEADDALYEAKKSGKNCIRIAFDPLLCTMHS